MNESTKELNKIFHKHNVSDIEIAYWLYMTLERMTQDYREDYLDDYGSDKMKRLDALADDINEVVHNYWYLLQ